MRSVCGNKTAVPTGRRGFTLAELLVASVVMSTALLGVNALFRHALDTEGQAAVRWQDRAAAGRAAEHLAEAMAQCVNLPEMNGLVAGSDSDTDGWIICQVGLERRRYRWYVADVGPGCVLELQKMVVAGTRNLCPVAASQGQAGPTGGQAWDRIEAKVIASRLDGLSILFKSLEGKSGDWRSDWDGPVGRVIALIRATVGNETVERAVRPLARGRLVQAGKGSESDDES